MKVEVYFQPLGRRGEVDSGRTILEAARGAGVGLSAICGGEGSCDACRVRLVDQGEVAPPNDIETDALSPDELRAGARLACQTQVFGSIRVDIPPKSLTAMQRTQVEGVEDASYFDPPLDVMELELPRAEATDPRADLERLLGEAAERGRPGLRCPQLSVLQQIPELIRGNGWRIQLGIRGEELVSVAPPGTPLLGLAVDVGTTKVAGYLVDMGSGDTLAMKGIMNPQIAYGEDVMARITHCLRQDDGLRVQQAAIVGALNELALELCAVASSGGNGESSPVYDPAQIVEVVMVGNTAMHHLLLGLPVDQLGRSPYVAAVSSPLDVKASQLGLDLSPGSTVHLPGNIAGFVGADHLSMLLATQTHTKEGVVVSLDIGTNTEITLAANGRMIACSTASGPAFEGAHIRDGMRAAEGAIERVQILDGKLSYQTIGNVPPVGICGSGILDAIAQLRLSGALDEKGGLNEDHPLVRRGGKLPEVVLAPASKTGHGKDLTLNRADINEIQLAKGAMRAGIELLLEEAGVTAGDVEEFIIAGAFGSYISVEAAVAIGMFPDLPLERFRQVGNAAGMGARQALLSTARRAEASRIADDVEYLELTVSERFQEEFLKAMYL